MLDNTLVGVALQLRDGRGVRKDDDKQALDPPAGSCPMALKLDRRSCPATLRQVVQPAWVDAKGLAPRWVRRLGLPPRLTQIAASLALGESDREIAERFDLSLHTVRSYTKQLYRRLDRASRVQVAAHVLELMGCQYGRTRNLGGRCCGWARQLALPPRLARVASCAIAGQSDKECAEQLGLSEHTVRTYIKQLYARLGVRNRTELLFALGHGSAAKPTA